MKLADVGTAAGLKLDLDAAEQQVVTTKAALRELGVEVDEPLARVDWTKPIEAVRKSDGFVFPVTLRTGVPSVTGRYETNECPDGDSTNTWWRPDGSDCCTKNEWFIRNCAESNREVLERTFADGRPPEQVFADPWGKEIVVNGVRPLWLADDDQILCRDKAAIGRKDGDWVSHIRLPVGHWAYQAIEAGYEPWAGGDSAPADWDEGEVLLDDGATTRGYRVTSVGWQRRAIPGCRHIIGYRKKAKAEPDHLTITLTGPQGCGKTVVAEWLRSHVERNGSMLQSQAAFLQLEGKNVTIIDSSADE